MNTEMDKLWLEMEEICLRGAKKLLEDVDYWDKPIKENVEMADKLVYMATSAVMTRQRRQNDANKGN